MCVCICMCVSKHAWVCTHMWSLMLVIFFDYCLPYFFCMSFVYLCTYVYMCNNMVLFFKMLFFLLRPLSDQIQFQGNML